MNYEIKLALRYSPEYWADIPDYEGLYQVSNKGRIKSLTRNVKHRSGLRTIPEKILQIKTRKRTGYQDVSLCKNGVAQTKSIHRLVMSAFVGTLDLEIDHINRNPSDNNLANLQYLTREQHTIKDKLGRLRPKLQGINHHNAKLTDEEVIEIYNLAWFSNLTQEEIAGNFNINQATVSEIKKRKCWGHLTKDLPTNKKYHPKTAQSLTKEQVLQIRELNLSSRKIGAMFNVSHSTILGIKSGKYWGWL